MHCLYEFFSTLQRNTGEARKVDFFWLNGSDEIEVLYARPKPFEDLGIFLTIENILND